MTATPASPVILVLTVGGSEAPLLRAIEDTAPARLLLIASEGGGAQASSRDAARGLGDAFMARSPGHAVDHMETPSDDPAAAFGRILATLDTLSRNYPDHAIVANYTGGTKSMSTALLMAAFQRGHRTQLTTGVRQDLARVTSGTESSLDIDTRLIAVESELETALRVARGGDYAAAHALFEFLRDRLNNEGLKPTKTLRNRLEFGRTWSQCMAAWDRFDHKDACRMMQSAAAGGAPWARDLERFGHAAILRELATGRNEPTAALCLDLLENARRRLAQRRFDDALARLYRFVEACAQTQLFRRWGLKSGELAEANIPADLREGLKPEMNPRLGVAVFKFGLMQTMRLLERRDPLDPLARGYLDAGPHGPEWLNARNGSILAHGYGPIERRVVENAFTWIDAVISPAMGLTPMGPFPTGPFGSKS